MLDHGRDAAGGGRHRAGREVLALGVPGILEVRVHVDAAGHDDESRGIDQLVRRAGRAGLGERADAAVLDHDVGGEDRRLGRHRAAGDHGPLAAHSHRLTLSERLPAADVSMPGKIRGRGGESGLSSVILRPSLGA